MFTPHFINIALHVLTGIAAIVIGFTILSITKGVELHRKLGKIFCYLSLIVCGTAILGLVAFRFMPLFAILTLFVLYQLFSGWRSIYTKFSGPAKLDAAATIIATVIAILLIQVTVHNFTGNKVIIYSVLGSLAFILIYDSIRWLFPISWYNFLWRYEHSYKLISSLFGMLSALVGNAVRIGQPWSQIIPSVLGLIFISYFFYKLYKEDKNNLSKSENA